MPKQRKQRGGGFAADGAITSISSAINHIVAQQNREKYLRDPKNHKAIMREIRREALAPVKVRKNRNKALKLYGLFLNQRAIKRNSFYKKYGHLLPKRPKKKTNELPFFHGQS